MLRFSNQNVLGESINIFIIGRSHHLSFSSECSLFHCNGGIESFINLIVTLSSLCDNKIEENEESDKCHEQPKDPEDDIFLLGKILARFKYIITHTNSQSSNDVTDKLTNDLVF